MHPRHIRTSITLLQQKSKTRCCARMSRAPWIPVCAPLSRGATRQGEDVPYGTQVLRSQIMRFRAVFQPSHRAAHCLPEHILCRQLVLFSQRQQPKARPEVHRAETSLSWPRLYTLAGQVMCPLKGDTKQREAGCATSRSISNEKRIIHFR